MELKADPDTGGGRTRLRPWFQWLTILLFALVTLQPALAGWGYFKAEPDFIDIHGMVANIIFLNALALLVLALLAGFRRRTLLIGWSALTVVLVTAQIGLGYSGREEATSTALHVPLGVLVFGTSLMLMLFAHGFTVNRENA